MWSFTRIPNRICQGKNIFRQFSCYLQVFRPMFEKIKRWTIYICVNFVKRTTVEWTNFNYAPGASGQILNIRPLARTQVSYTKGTGESISLWHDPWFVRHHWSTNLGTLLLLEAESCNMATPSTITYKGE